MNNRRTTTNRCWNALLDSGVRRRLLPLAIGAILGTGCADGSPTDPTLPPLQVTTASLPDGVVNVSYGTETLTATGGDGSYSWRLASAQHPTGLSLDANGVITGTPTATGTQDLTAEVTSGDGQTARRALSITVRVPPVLQPNESCVDHPAYALATFEDGNLEEAIRASLSVGSPDALTCGRLATLTEFEAPSLGIVSLVGIQNLTGLWFVDLHDNRITDISPLRGLTSLTWLDLFRNAITDIGPLSELTGLEFLNLNHNAITDISAVSGLTDVATLFLGNNSITDISALSGLPSLDDLSLAANPINDIGALDGLTGLTRLRLGRTSISDFGPLSGLTRLTFLSLPDNSITDVTALSGVLSGLTNLKQMTLANNSISDLSPLSALTRLTYLGLANNSFTDIDALGGLTSLETLFLSKNPVSDISALGGLTGLTFLGLSDNPDLNDIKPLLDNTGLGAGVSVVLLRSNNVGCEDVAALRARGVTVYSSACQ